MRGDSKVCYSWCPTMSRRGLKRGVHCSYKERPAERTCILSLISLMVSVDVKHHQRKKERKKERTTKRTSAFPFARSPLEPLQERVLQQLLWNKQKTQQVFICSFTQLSDHPDTISREVLVRTDIPNWHGERGRRLHFQATLSPEKWTCIQKGSNSLNDWGWGLGGWVGSGLGWGRVGGKV